MLRVKSFEANWHYIEGGHLQHALLLAQLLSTWIIRPIFSLTEVEIGPLGAQRKVKFPDTLSSSVNVLHVRLRGGDQCKIIGEHSFGFKRQRVPGIRRHYCLARESNMGSPSIIRKMLELGNILAEGWEIVTAPDRILRRRRAHRL